MVLYGQIVIGAPGSGKTTYCDGMQQYLTLLGRECHVVNLDPANETPPTAEKGDAAAHREDDAADAAKAREAPDVGDIGNAQLPYDALLDVSQDVISLDAVMSELDLGPNGGLVYCM